MSEISIAECVICEEVEIGLKVCNIDSIVAWIEWDILINDHLTLELCSETDKLLTLTDSTIRHQEGTEEPTPQAGTPGVRSHIGISGNGKADKRAAYKLGLGRIAGSQQAATGAGIGIAAKARQKGTQKEPGFWVNRCL
ncbi:hypothetical protein EV426DRAFT_643159 [Tirmania nivea]|nr:hypothetical protein EV426DRAFT_643159 [Tirmania nivea]